MPNGTSILLRFRIFRPACVARGLVLALAAGMLEGVRAEPAESVLPEVIVYSPKVAIQNPAATFAMPVSALRFEPQVDLQSRNFVEGQSDVTIRGGIFENTGFSVGAITLYDPQTGHYFSEIPIAPVMLTAPEVVTGADLAIRATNATTGAVAYSWRPIRAGGTASFGGGDHGLTVAEFYQGYVLPHTESGPKLGADFAWAHSDGNGSVPNGDHELNRFAARIQMIYGSGQTDVFAGYQDKFFGWPNLYTPFNSNESEDIQTLLIALNHRVRFGGDNFVEVGAYYRRNDDDYAFNRFAPVGPVHPFQHTTWVHGASLTGRLSQDAWTLNFRAEGLSDEIKSTSLIFGPYRTREIIKLAAVPERAWQLGDGSRLRVKVGASYDDTNHGDSALSPIVEVARESASGLRFYASYAEATQVPTYTALKSNPAAGLFRGNPFLERETSRNAEVGITGHLDEWIMQAALFHRRDENLVDWTFRQGVTARSANPVDVATTGVELVARRSLQKFDVIFGYTGLSKDPDYRGAAVDASFYAGNYARHRITAGIVARLRSDFELRMDNEIRFQAANILRTVGGDDAVLTSLAVSYRPPSMRRLTLTLQAENLWDSDYQQVPSVPASRRQVSITARYSW